MVRGLCERGIVDGGGPVSHLSSHILAFCPITDHAQLLVIGITVANVRLITYILKVDDEGVS
jgi:hypothetical protein